nr:unnamed protein product [Callosobruchus chinensis]
MVNIAAGFETHSKHIKLIHSAGSVSTYFNYKKYFSMVLLAVCDSNYRFTYIDTGFLEKLLIHLFSRIVRSIEKLQQIL